jgi:hypothetical protein
MGALACFDVSELVGDLLADPGWLFVKPSDFDGDAVASRPVLGDCDFGVSRDATRGEASDFMASPALFGDVVSSNGFGSFEAIRGDDPSDACSCLEVTEGVLFSAVVWALGVVGSPGRAVCESCTDCRPVGD